MGETLGRGREYVKPQELMHTAQHGRQECADSSDSMRNELSSQLTDSQLTAHRLTVSQLTAHSSQRNVNKNIKTKAMNMLFTTEKYL